MLNGYSVVISSDLDFVPSPINMGTVGFPVVAPTLWNSFAVSVDSAENNKCHRRLETTSTMLTARD